MDEDENLRKWILFGSSFIILLLLIGMIWCLEYKNRKLEAQLKDMSYEFEGVIIAVSDDGGTIYCMNENAPEGYVIEIDVFNEVLCNCHGNCTLHVGDRVLYCVDSDWQDADLIVKIHEYE